MAQISLLYFSSLILLLHAALTLGHVSSNIDEVVVLDVSASLNKASQVFSSSNELEQRLIPLSADPTTKIKDSSIISIPLHTRSSLDHHHDHVLDLVNDNTNIIVNNYTSLTLSRLARDHARVHSILAKHSYALSTSKSNRHPSPKPQQLYSSPLVSGASQGSGEYFARLGVGQPAKEALMVIDTGSDITWLQCEPCTDCYEQANPIFNPSGSSTYKPVSCLSQQCTSLQVSACRDQTCLYQVSYGDGSYTVGEFATETISFDSTSSSSSASVALGCGRDNEGLFSGADGLLGLGRGSLSLPSQIKATSFSYCLVNRDSRATSTLEFNTAQPSDSVVAPLLTNTLIRTFHYVGLTGISIGGHPLNIPSSLFSIGLDGRGGVIIDSGTAVTRLRTEAYNIVRDEFKRLTGNLRSASGFSLFDTCYDFSSMTSARVPTVSFQFSGGKTLPLPPSNYLIPVDDAGKFCFAFAGTSGTLSIIGNVQQQGTRVSYNLASNSIGFSPNKC